MTDAVVHHIERSSEQEQMPITCDGCGVEFAVPALLFWRLSRVGRPLWCPNGHLVGATYTEPVLQTIERLRALAAELHTELWLERNGHQATHRELVDLQHRIAHGRCPIPSCGWDSTTYSNHMTKHHPEFETEDV